MKWLNEGKILVPFLSYKKKERKNFPSNNTKVVISPLETSRFGEFKEQ